MEISNATTGADEDMYSDKMGDAAPAKDDGDKGKDDGRDSQEAILPRSICPHMDMAVGDKIELEVTAIHDKEFSVKYSTPKDDGDDKGGDKAPMPAAMGGGQDSMYD